MGSNETRLVHNIRCFRASKPSCFSCADDNSRIVAFTVLFRRLFAYFIVFIILVKKFDVLEGDIFVLASVHKLAWLQILSAMALGFCLSLLFFMDQNIAGVMVNSPDNRCVNYLELHCQFYDGKR